MKPRLSILIPAFNYPEGIDRIFLSLLQMQTYGYEVIVFDNSTNDEVCDVIEKYVYELPVTYKKIQGNGAINNWNELLEAAQGDYFVLLHHDEFFIGVNFLENIFSALKLNPDLLLLDCILVDPITLKNKRHIPMWFRLSIVKYFPSYLLKRNLIGPTASIIVKRELYTRFNDELKWLVDVDNYVRILRSVNNIVSCENSYVGSVLNRSDSITASLGGSIKKIKKQEKLYLLGLEGNRKTWLSDLVWYRSLNVIETLFWMGFRLMDLVIQKLKKFPVSKETVGLYFDNQTNNKKL